MLLEQVWVHDGESRVKAVVQKAGAKLTGFARFQLGEGIEKQAGDFAAEVAAASGVPQTPATPDRRRRGSFACPGRAAPLRCARPRVAGPRIPMHPPPAAASPASRRVLLKLSGEALMGRREYGLDTDTVSRIATDIRDVVAMGVQVCLVIGGGNIFRGVRAAAGGMDRAQADYMGMLATVMNALAMQNALEKRGVPTRVQSAIPMAASASRISAAAPSGTWRRGGW